MTIAMTNGRLPRKQLADQLDRLDGIIDLLGEGLSQAVADACRDGSRLAVKDAILEILANPELRRLIGNPAPAPSAAAPLAEPLPIEPPGPPRWERIKAKLRLARRALSDRVRRACTAILSPWRKLRDTLAILTSAGGEPLPLRRIGIVALGLGASVAFASLLMPHTAASAAAGASAALTATVLQIGGWLKSVYRRFAGIN